MPFIRPRLNDYYELPFIQEEVDFAIPLLDDDIPLYVDPFLLWKSPSLQDNALHTALVSSFNHFGYLAANGQELAAIKAVNTISECKEVGLGFSKNKRGHKIGEQAAQEILSLFQLMPQVKSGGFNHIEEIQLFVEQISKDRISDITCSLIKSFLIDYTIDQCSKWNIPISGIDVEVFDYRARKFIVEKTQLPINPSTQQPIILVPKRWLRFVPWIDFDDYFMNSFKKVSDSTDDLTRIEVLTYNRQNYDVVQAYIKQKERTADNCKNDPLFAPVPIISAKRRLSDIKKLPTGNNAKADKLYEDYVGQLMASLVYPQLDFADEQVRSDSGVLIRDLVFYNNRSYDFLADIYDIYDSHQIVMELKTVSA